MKIKIILTLACVLVANTLYGQNYPQVTFYGTSDLSSLIGKAENHVEEYNNARIEIVLSSLFGELDEKKNLELYYKMYLIEHTSELHYTMNDGGKLYFYCTNPDEKDDDYADFMKGDKVDFGTPLVKVEQTKEGVNHMRFESKVTQIDPAIFQDGVTEIRFPYNEGMKYLTSKNTSVRDLRSIKGKDVIDNALLVSQNKTLIAGAFASKDEYVFPEGVDTIGEGAMRRNTLSSITFPATLKRVEAYALEGCENLRFISFPSSDIVQFSVDAFGDAIPTDIEFKVSKKLLKQYKKTYPDLKKQFKAL